jgi:hypothetical protein
VVLAPEWCQRHGVGSSPVPRRPRRLFLRAGAGGISRADLGSDYQVDLAIASDEGSYGIDYTFVEIEFRPEKAAEFLEGEALRYRGWAVKSPLHEADSGFG